MDGAAGQVGGLGGCGSGAVLALLGVSFGLPMGDTALETLLLAIALTEVTEDRGAGTEVRGIGTGGASFAPPL